MKLLQGKRFVVTGIASKLSIAWAIAEALHREGASLILTYPNEKMKKRVDMAAEQFSADLVLPCDVASDAEIEACFAAVAEHWEDGIDGVARNTEKFKGMYAETIASIANYFGIESKEKAPETILLTDGRSNVWGI